MSLSLDEVSIVYWFPDRDKHRCGYCKQENCGISYGCESMWADSMTVDDYQDIIDRGWRRSGKYCYKPIMNETCCPQYTIRCDAVNFKLSKSQKKVIKKFNKFLTDGSLCKETEEKIAAASETPGESHIIFKDRPNFITDYQRMDKKIKIDALSPREEFMAAAAASSSLVARPDDNSPRSQAVKPNLEVKRGFVKKGIGADPSKPPTQKAKLLRMERKRKKLEARGLTLDSSQTVEKEAKTLAQYLTEIAGDPNHKLEIKLYCMSQPDDQLSTNVATEHKIYQKYQTVIHDDPPEKCSLQSFKRFLVHTPLKIKLVELNSDEESFDASAKLFEKYQMQIHDEKQSDCDVEQFQEFLVDTPLKAKPDPGGTGVTFGSYHQQYWIDGKLVAVGVIDVLPRCVSSVYFFYDPEYRNLTLGTYGSLREVDYVQKLSKKIPELKDYYMGFYIHSCSKMRYKGKLCPSYLLCPETYRWMPIGGCLPKLEASKYSRLDDSFSAVDENACSSSDIETIKILIGYQYTTFRHYRYKSRDLHIYQTIGKLIGRKSIDRFMFIQQTS